jgi:hypothetical protein
MGVNKIDPGTNREFHKRSLTDRHYNPESQKRTLSEVRHTGFYYDSQLLDPSMTMTLHPSTYNDGGEWKEFIGDVYPPFIKGVSYSKTPIAVCLLSEDPSFSTSNNFTDFNGGNPIEDVFNRMKPYAPLMGKLSEGIKNSNTKEAFGAGIGEIINKGAEWFGDIAGKAESVLNKALFIQGTRFTYYNGSNFSTGQMEMKFTKFSEYNVNGTFINVAKYISETLAPYCYGRYQSLTEDGAMNKTFDGPLAGSMSRFIADYCGVQAPPGGFKMDAQSLDSALFGTLRLNIGGVYAVENLLIKSMTFSFSRSQAKDPENPGKTVPLYADITLSLCPASMVTDNSFKEMLDGKGLENIMTVRGEENKAMLNKMKTDRKNAFSSIADKIQNY